MNARALLALVPACVAAAAATGQPAGVGATLAEIDRLDRRAADPLLAVEERAAAADGAIGLRRRLIESASGDESRRITWHIDQGAAILARLGSDAADTAVLFGLPTDDQRRRVTDAAVETARLLAGAHSLAAGVTDEQTRLSLREGGDANPLLTALRDEQIRGQLVRGRGAVLHAAVSADAAGRRERAQAAIDALSGIGFEEPAGEASRRVSLGAALALRGEPGDSAAGAQHFAWVIGPDGQGRPGVLPASVAEGMLGRLHTAHDAMLESVMQELTRTRTLPPRTVRGVPDPLWHLLFADAVGRTQIERWRARGDPKRLGSAFGVYDALTDASIGLGPADLRGEVLARRDAMSRWGGEIPLELLPPGAAFARGVGLARRTGGREEAIRVFEELTGRADAGSIRADALWELGVLTGAGGDRLRSVQVTTRFARDYPGDARADQAIAYAVHFAHALASDPASSEAGRRALADALRVATSSFTHLPDIDRWRVDRARLLLDPSPEHDRATGLALLEAVPGSSPVASDAATLYEQVQGSYLDAARARLIEAFRRADEPEVKRLASQIAAEAGRAIDWARAHARPTLDRFRVDLADALLESGDAAAAAGLFRDVLDRATAVPGGAIRVRLGLGRALAAAGDDAGAFAALRDLVSPLDAQAPSAARPGEYWHAWAIMLEILARTDGVARAGAVRVHTQRLSAIDPAWGGEPWRSRIQRTLDGLAERGKP